MGRTAKLCAFNRPGSEKLELLIVNDVSLVHVVYLVQEHQMLHGYAHGGFACLHSLSSVWTRELHGWCAYQQQAHDVSAGARRTKRCRRAFERNQPPPPGACD